MEIDKTHQQLSSVCGLTALTTPTVDQAPFQNTLSFPEEYKFDVSQTHLVRKKPIPGHREQAAFPKQKKSASTDRFSKTDKGVPNFLQNLVLMFLKLRRDPAATSAVRLYSP